MKAGVDEHRPGVQNPALTRTRHTPGLDPPSLLGKELLKMGVVQREPLRHPKHISSAG